MDWKGSEYMYVHIHWLRMWIYNFKISHETSDLIRLIVSEPRHENHKKKLQWCNLILMTTNNHAMQQFYGFIIPFLCHPYIHSYLFCAKNLNEFQCHSVNDEFFHITHSFFYWDMSKNKSPICCLFFAFLCIVYWMSLWHL